MGGLVALAVLVPLFLSEVSDAQDALARSNVVWTERFGCVRRGRGLAPPARR